MHNRPYGCLEFVRSAGCGVGMLACTQLGGRLVDTLLGVGGLQLRWHLWQVAMATKRSGIISRGPQQLAPS